MTRESYEKLLEELGYNPAYFKRGSLLRHDLNRHLPRIYFNNKRDGFVFFTVRREESGHYPTMLWREIEPQQIADSGSVHMTVVPKRGRERAAFADLRSRKLTQPATYRT